MGCERKRGVKDDSKVFGLSSLTAKIELQPMDTGKTESIANWMASVCVCGYEMWEKKELGMTLKFLA